MRPNRASPHLFPVTNSIRRLSLVGSFALAAIGLSAETAPPSFDAKANSPGLLSPLLKVAQSGSFPPVVSAQPAVQGRAEENIPVKAEGELVVLPRFEVRGRRSPKPDDLLTPAGTLDRYLGSRSGLDRGLLNRFALNWGNDVVSFSLFAATKNETRAKTMFADDERLRNRETLLDLVSLLKETGDVKESKQLKQESDSLFTRKPTSDRK